MVTDSNMWEQIWTCEMKWNESGFRPPLCTYRLNWARRTSWGWWDDWDDTVLQTQDSKFEPWRSEAEHATSRSGRLPTILTFTRGWVRNIICFFQTAETGNRTSNSGVKGIGANHYPRAPAHLNLWPQIPTNLWPQIRICGNRFESVGTDCDLFGPQIAICGNRFESLGTDCNLFGPQIAICGNRFESVRTDCNLWPQI